MNNPDEKKSPPRGADDKEPVRHKGLDRSTEQEKEAGPQPEGNGGTGQHPP